MLNRVMSLHLLVLSLSVCTGFCRPTLAAESALVGSSQRADSPQSEMNSQQNPVAPIPADGLPATPSQSSGQSIHQPARPEVNAGTLTPRAETTADGHPSVALTLAGGGGRGAAHIGVLKVLKAAGIKVDFVSGSSIGAIIGSLYCAGVPIERIEQIALDGELKKGLLPSGLKWQACKTLPRYALMRALMMHPPVGLYSGENIARFIQQNVPPGVTQVEQLKIPFAAIATNMLDTRPFWIEKGNLSEAVRASATVPFVYQPAHFNNKVLVDGGIRSNLPTKPARLSGAKIVIAVRLQANLEAQPERKFRTFIDYSDRILTMLLSEIETKAVANADVLIEPDIKDTKTYTFASEDIAKAIRAGEEAAIKALPDIRRRLQNCDTAMTNEHDVENELAKQQ